MPTQRQRESILKVLLSDMELERSDINSVANHIASITPGYVGADLALVCQEVSLQSYKRLVMLQILINFFLVKFYVKIIFNICCFQYCSCKERAVQY